MRWCLSSSTPAPTKPLSMRDGTKELPSGDGSTPFFLFFASPLFSLCLFSPPSDSTKNLFHKTRRWVGPFEGISLSFFGSFLITDLLLRLFESFYLRIEASLSVNASDACPLTLLWLFFVFLFFHTRLGLFVSLFCLSTLMNVFTPCGVGFYL